MSMPSREGKPRGKFGEKENELNGFSSDGSKGGEGGEGRIRRGIKIVTNSKALTPRNSGHDAGEMQKDQKRTRSANVICEFLENGIQGNYTICIGRVSKK